MRKFLCSIAMVFACFFGRQELRAQAAQKPGNWAALKLSATSPTPVTDAGFANAYPLGNGRLGAKVYGVVASELMYVNDVNLWSGVPTNKDNASVVAVTKNVRAALAAGNYTEANRLAGGMTGPPCEAYQPLGTINLDFDGASAYSNYSRTLDLDQALITVKYTVNGVNYTRETFASNPGQVIVTRLYANQRGKVTMTARMSTQLQGRNTVEGSNTMVVTGRAPRTVDAKNVAQWDPLKGIGFESRMVVKNSGGTVAPSGNNIRITNADTVLLIFSSATSFNGYDKDPVTNGIAPSPVVKGYIANASSKTYAQLLSAHLSEYRGLFRRLWVDINNSATFKAALLYQCSRYSLIACSRPGGIRPRNEQGIWNKDVVPHYRSNYTLNENPQKHYSLAEPGNIGETVMPLINFITDLSKKGAGTARTNYGFRGWVTHHNSDVWAMTTMAPGSAKWSCWPVGGIWLTQHVWERYAFSMDQTYLRNTAYPIMKGAVEFALDLLVDNGRGQLVTSPSTSPENQFVSPNDGAGVAVSRGSTADMSLVRELFANYLKAAGTLGLDATLQQEVRTAQGKLLPYKVGSKGQLQEWSEDFVETEPTHRHISNLLSVWPMSQITQRGTPTLFAAARKSMELRGSGGYHPDKAAMWARMLDGDKAAAALDGSWPTLYEARYSGFSEMLMQSHTGDIDLLPALPTAWSAGKVLGLRARGNYEVDVVWSGGNLVSCTIRSFSGTTPTVRVKGVLVNPATDSRITLTGVSTGSIVSGATYTIAAVHSGQNLDVSARSTADGAKVVQYNASGSTNQQWVVTDIGGGYYTLRAVHSGKNMAVLGNSLLDTAAIVQMTPTGSATSQQFRIVPQADGSFTISNRNSGKCVDIKGRSLAPIAPAQQYTCNGGTNQKFRFSVVSNARSIGPAEEEGLFKSQSDVVAFPNPSSTSFHVRAKGNFSYVIINSDGKLVEEGKGSDESTVGKGLKPGVYILQVKTATGTKEIKLSKN